MFAVSGKKLTDARLRAGANAPAGNESFVLPRPLRRVVRFVISLCSGRIAIPDHVGTVSLALFSAAVTAQGVVAGGHTSAVFQAATSIVGFAIEDVRVSGNTHTSELDILQLLGLDGTTSLVALDIDTARARLTELPWVQAAEVRKIYPRTIEVALKEREAYGIWQHGEELSLIEKSGSIIAPLRDSKFASLPLFVGRDADRAAAAVQSEFQNWPQIASRVKAYVRVAGRRWDLHLDNGIVVKLPQDDMPEALALLSRLDTEQNLLSRDIAAVDLRLKDRTVVQLTPEAQARRQAAVDARAKVIKLAEQRT